MAELYSVRCYYSTGFNAGNRPADISVLSSANYRDFPSNYLRQNKDIATTRVKASWNEVADADYIRIGDAFYLVAGIAMLSDQTAEIALTLDPLLSMGGVGAIGQVSGWTERAHVAPADDTLFANVLAEPWAPSQPLEMDQIELIGPTPGEPLNLVLSTVKLDDITHVAEVYTTEASAAIGGSVTVPKIPEATEKTYFALNAHVFQYPGGSFYNYDYEGIPNSINDVRSLGIESAIIAAYQVPKNFCVTQPTGARVGSLENVAMAVTPSENKNYRYGHTAVHNTKVYALYNDYTLLSACSGDRATWKAEDLYSGGNAPTFRHYADLSPSGRPYMQPDRYHGSITALYQEAVKGENWFRLPYSYTGISGSRVAEASRRRQLTGEIVDASVGAYEQARNVMDSLSPLALAGSGGMSVVDASVGAANFALKTDMSMRESAVNYQTQQRIVAPVIAFPQEYGAQAYLGNVFYLYRTRLSDNDMVRADNFFTQFGYAQDKKFEISDLQNRQYFNFIKTRDADIVGTAPLRIRLQCAQLFNSGVRLWHVLPNAAAMYNNP